MFFSPKFTAIRLRFLLLTLVAFSTLASTALVHAEDAVAPTATVEATAGLDWHSDYNTAYRKAKQEKKLLLVNFLCQNGKDDQQQLEQSISTNASLQEKLPEMVLLRIPCEYEILLEEKSEKLLSQAAFQEMHGKPGIAIIDLKHEDKPYYGNVVSAFPFMSSKYYRWKVKYVPEIVDLPEGTLTQRTMVWAVRVHPEGPKSTNGKCAPQLATAAASHSNSQARRQQQGHHNWSSRFHKISNSVNAHDAKEVVAESWPNQTMIDSCIDCVASWRHSSGHWGAVRSRHRLFGYDIKRGRNGIWYGTGIFAN